MLQRGGDLDLTVPDAHKLELMRGAYDTASILFDEILRHYRAAGKPSAYLALREKLPEIKRRTGSGQSLDPLLENFDVRALPLETAASILLGIIQSVLRQIEEDQ